MKNYLLCLAAGLLTGCLATKVSPDTPDSVFFLPDAAGQVQLSSLNSAQHLKITEQRQVADTLLLSYEKRFVSKRSEPAPGANTVRLTPSVRLVKCADQVFRVVRQGTAVTLERQ
ncbi:hypothetical protein E5K00_13730 [Hymenobacter aquaticus]|uniref:Lipoprotein n=1 Tax=Hymenobacter aquaticus TaxID=1867101 RepID=A0A4Z0PV22_9BACT|nr:hypothetical protein [Hymenobacter aquaticus]TGE21345.1 hypothetical protein E5K00_13730 [Hymenobacter aquaticus]